jgi:tRNA A37 methylthiotransferase MiaB
MMSTSMHSDPPSEAVPEMPKKQAFIAVNGCHENYMDAALVQRYLGEMCGVDPAPDAASADIILVRGCSVTQHMEDESRDLIAHLQKVKRPDAKLFVIGCIAKTNPALQADDTDALIPLVSINSLANHMDQNARRLAVNHLHQTTAEVDEFLVKRKEGVFAAYTGVKRGGLLGRLSAAIFGVLFRGTRCYKDFIESRLDPCNQQVYAIKICTGCQGECTYCSVRLTRGAVRSKTIEEVVAEFQRGLDQGYRHFALIGTDIGDYGKDLGVDLIDLLRRIVDLPTPFRLRLRNLSPRWVIARCNEFCEVLQSRKIVFAQIAIQSGNDRILGLMKRGYRSADVMRAVAKIRRACPPIVLRTQIIAGFPSETDAEFRDSMAVVDSRLFEYADFFRYTPRPCTEAATFGPEVPFEVTVRRYRKLFLKILFRRPLQKLSAMRRMRTCPPQADGKPRAFGHD